MPRHAGNAATDDHEIGPGALFGETVAPGTPEGPRPVEDEAQRPPGLEEPRQHARPSPQGDGDEFGPVERRHAVERQRALGIVGIGDGGGEPGGEAEGAPS